MKMDTNFWFRWDGWNVLELPEDISHEILQLEVYPYSSKKEAYEHLPEELKDELNKKLLIKYSDGEYYYYFFYDKLNFLARIKDFQPMSLLPVKISKYPQKTAISLMSAYVKKILGKKLKVYVDSAKIQGFLENPDIGVRIRRIKTPQIKVVGFNEKTVYVAIKYSSETETLKLWELPEKSLDQVMALIEEHVQNEEEIKIKSPKIKSNNVFSYIVKILKDKEAYDFLLQLKNSTRIKERNAYLRIEESIKSLNPAKSPLDAKYVILAVPKSKYSRSSFSKYQARFSSYLQDLFIFTELNSELIIDPKLESILFNKQEEDVVKNYANAVKKAEFVLKFKSTSPHVMRLPEIKNILMAQTEKGPIFGWGVRGLLLTKGTFREDLIPFVNHKGSLKILIYYPEHLERKLKRSIFYKRVLSLKEGVYGKAFTNGAEIVDRPLEKGVWKELQTTSALDKYSEKIIEDFESMKKDQSDTFLLLTLLPKDKNIVKFHKMRSYLLKKPNLRVAIQGINESGLDDNYKSYSALLQTAPKLGVYMYSLNPEVISPKYDLILGIDVTRQYEATQRGVAASVVLMTPNGIPKGGFAISQNTNNKETVNLFEVFQELFSAPQVKKELKNRNSEEIGILLARDGFFTISEREDLSTILESGIFEEFGKSGVTLNGVEIIKDTGIRIWKHKKFLPSYTSLPSGNLTQYVVLGHKGMNTQKGTSYARPYTVRGYYYSKDGYIKGPETLPRNLLHYLIYLQRLNYTTYLDAVISLPAPAHFAHKCSNFVRKFEISRVAIENALFFVT
ncbi:Piwi domain-containing protein [Thermococcus alcaliphilus]|uniref:Piwi domain-containing protein n=1 Tax=Thermococcus alcaliphilus TaxID=139207 RepID=UPI002090A355|nr:Piwi domain-containing protein [Thermococcus alcaliphilus]MCO6041858.1 hypothetical protein [Thermococcus alcaliphilus]